MVCRFWVNKVKYREKLGKNTHSSQQTQTHTATHKVQKRIVRVVSEFLRKLQKKESEKTSHLQSLRKIPSNCNRFERNNPRCSYPCQSLRITSATRISITIRNVCECDASIIPSIQLKATDVQYRIFFTRIFVQVTREKNNFFLVLFSPEHFKGKELLEARKEIDVGSRKKNRHRA